MRGIVVVAAFLVCCAEDRALFRTTQDSPRDRAIIHSALVRPAIGRWTLLRKNGRTCAIRFVEHFSSTDQAAAIAEYEWAEIESTEPSRLESLKATSGTATFDYQPCLGRVAFQGGDDSVGCPSLRVAWRDGTSLTFGSSGVSNAELLRREVQIGLTGWCELKAIRPNDERVRWLVYEERRELTLPLGDCWETHKKN